MQMADRLCLLRLNLKTSGHGGVLLLDTRIVTHMTLDHANVNIVWNQLCETRVRLTRHLYDKGEYKNASKSNESRTQGKSSDPQ